MTREPPIAATTHDADIVVRREWVTAATAALTAAGYTQGDLGVTDREAFLAPDKNPARHVYICVENTLHVRNHLTVRNTLLLTAGGTAFLNGSLGIATQTTAGATTSFVRDPSGTLICMRTSTGASFYYTTDALGSTILLTDTAQAAAATYAYNSWGVTTSTGAQTATNPWTYAGGYNDTSNSHIKFGARYYNPTQGRFTQPDPSGQENNRYLYAGANPINYADPSGYFFACGTTLCPDPGSAPYCSPSVGCAIPTPGPATTDLRIAVACYVGAYASLLALIPPLTVCARQVCWTV